MHLKTASSRTRNAQLLFSSTCAYSPQSEPQAPAQVPELNGTAGEGLRVTHREEFITPETSRRTNNSTESSGKSQVSAISPSQHLRWLEIKAAAALKMGLDRMQDRMHWWKLIYKPLYRGCTNANQWSARGPLSCSPLMDSWGPGPGIPTSASLPHRENKLLWLKEKEAL